MNGRARVELIEIDLSTRVPSFPGVYGAMVINTSKGKLDHPTLITSEAELFRLMMATDKITVNDPLSLFEARIFLNKSNKLWLVRPDCGQTYGGAYLAQDIPVHEIKVSTNQGQSGFFMRTTTEDEAEDSAFVYSTISDGDPIQVSGKQIPTPLKEGTNYFAVKFSKDKYGIRLAETKEEALEGNYIVFESAGTEVILHFTPDDLNGEQQYQVRNPDGYELDTSDGKAAGFESPFTVDVEGDYLNVSSGFYKSVVTGDPVTVLGNTPDIPAVDSGLPIEANETYYLISVPQEGPNADKYKVQLARTKSDALSEIPIGLGGVAGPSFQLKLDAKSSSSDATLDLDTDLFDVSQKFYDIVSNNDKITMQASTYPQYGSTTPTASTSFFAIKSPTNRKVALAKEKNGSPIDFTVNGADIVLKDTTKTDTTVPTVDLSKDCLSVSEMFYDITDTGYKVHLESDGTLPKGLQVGKDYFVIKTGENKVIKLASTVGNAEAGIPVDILDEGILDAVQNQYHMIIDDHNETYNGYKRRCGYLYTSTPTNEEIYYKLYHYPYETDSLKWNDFDQSCAELVKEPGAFMILLYKKYGDQYLEVERHTCSRNEEHTDGYGRNIYVEKVLESSNYCRWKDNKAVNKNVYPCNQPTYAKLTGGYNGHVATTGEHIIALRKLANKRRYAITLIMDAGWSIPAYQQAIIDVSESRGTTLGILSTPIDAEQSSNYLEDLIAYRRRSLITSTSHAALYSPHVKIYDEYNDREIYISPTGHVGACISDTATNYEAWYAPAGNRRGVLNVLGVAREFSEGDEDALYDAGINPIDFHETYGIRIWGQKTLLNRASALDRVNVRMLLIVIEPAIEEFLQDFVFEINDEFSRELVVSKITPYLQSVKERRGMYAFSVICDESNNTAEVIDNNEMIADIPIQPARVAELIRPRIIINSTGASLTIA